jgi:Tfp pilus assembly protein PilF
MKPLKLALLFSLLVLAACGTSPRSGSDSSSGDRGKASAEAIRNLGEAYLAGGNLTAALRELKRAEGIDPDDHITQFDIGLVYLYRERYDQAIQYLQRAITLKPDFAPAINSLGNAYLSKGEWDKAIETYQRIIEDVFYGTPHFALSNMGLAYYQKKDYAEAEKQFQEALKMNPDFVNAQTAAPALRAGQGLRGRPEPAQGARGVSARGGAGPGLAARRGRPEGAAQAAVTWGDGYSGISVSGLGIGESDHKPPQYPNT